MKRLIIFFLFVFLISGIAYANSWPWQVHGGDPRKPGGIPNARDAWQWIVGPGGQTDYQRLMPDGLTQDKIYEAQVRIRQNGFQMIFIGNKGLIGPNGRPVISQVQGLTFNRNGIVIHGPVEVRWRNPHISGAYIPSGMSGWVPATDSFCANTFLVYVPPPPVVRIPERPLPPPEEPPKWQAPPMFAAAKPETGSQNSNFSFSQLGFAIVPKEAKINVDNSNKNSSNSNSSAYAQGGAGGQGGQGGAGGTGGYVNFNSVITNNLTQIQQLLNQISNINQNMNNNNNVVSP